MVWSRIQEPDWKPASESHPVFAFDLARKYEVCSWFFTSSRGGLAVDVPQEDYDRIAALISSDTSPVGIDAKKTCVIIRWRKTLRARALGTSRGSRR